MFERGNRVIVAEDIRIMIYRTLSDAREVVFKKGHHGTVVSPGFDGMYMVKFDNNEYSDESHDVWYIHASQLKLDCLDKSRGKFNKGFKSY